MGFYTNTEGSFACKPYVLNGLRKCELTALIYDDNESCYINGDRAFCLKKIDKKIHHFDNIFSEEKYVKDRENDKVNTVVTKPYSGNRTDRDTGIRKGERAKRQISPVSSGARVVPIAFYLDAAFMEKFFRMNPDNDASAEDAAEMYVILLANEMTYRTQTLKVQVGKDQEKAQPAKDSHSKNPRWEKNQTNNKVLIP